jgi:hypothetical protein
VGDAFLCCRNALAGLIDHPGIILARFAAVTRTCSRVTGQVPYQDFKFPVTAFTRHWSYNPSEMRRFSDWPTWLQTLVLLPHVLLGFAAVWLWWPKSGKEWRKFGFVAAYLFAFYLVMHFVFHA